MSDARIYKGKLVDLFKSRFVRCSHVHVSGRQCGSRILKPKVGEPRACLAHLGNAVCSECRGMMQSFIPPKGMVGLFNRQYGG